MSEKPDTMDNHLLTLTYQMSNYDIAIHLARIAHATSRVEGEWENFVELVAAVLDGVEKRAAEK